MMVAAYEVVLEFSRADRADKPHAFAFVPQAYLLRSPGGGFESAEFPWTAELLADLKAVRLPGRDPDAVQRIGDTLRSFLANAGWIHHEQQILAAAREGAPISVTIRSAAAELYALPWEFLTLKSTGQLIGGVPGLVVRYEWPEIASFPDRIAPAARRGRVLFAWSAAGGAVPAADHLAAIKAACADRGVLFDPERDVVGNASLARLDRALDDAARSGPPIDAVHLLCHGAALGGSYGLALDDAADPGAVAIVDAGRMQQIFAAHAGMVQLVVVAACDSGNSGALGNHLGSVAQMLHRAGVRSVVASRFPLSILGSVSFAAAFYAALVRDRSSLEQAFLAARDALFCDPAQLDWASVQLYGRRQRADGTYPLQWASPAEAPAQSGTSPGPAGRWGAWEPLGRSARQIAAARGPDGCVELFALDVDATLSACRQAVAGGPFGAWEQLADQVRAVQAVQDERDRISLFLIDAQGRVRQRLGVAPGVWDEPSLGGVVATRMSAACGAQGTLSVFAIHEDGQIRYNGQNFGGAGEWDRWYGGYEVADEQHLQLLAVRDGLGLVKAISLHDDFTLWSTQQNGEGVFASWERLGTQLHSFHAVARAGGRLQVCALDEHGGLCHCEQKTPGGGWGGWQRLGGTHSEVVAICREHGGLEVFGLTAAGQLASISQPDDSFGPWTAIAGPRLAQLVPIENGKGELELIALDRDGKLHRCIAASAADAGPRAPRS